MAIKFGIMLRSKYTGEEITLGGKFDSSEEAERFAKVEVCERCNSFSIIPLQEDSIWANRKQGFLRKLV